MKKIVLEKEEQTIVRFDTVSENTPIFAKKNNVLCGMLVKETKGWILKLGGVNGAYGHHCSLKLCIVRGMSSFGYEFFVV